MLLDGCRRNNPIPTRNRDTFLRLMMGKDMEDDPQFNKEAMETLQAEKILINRMQILGYDITPYAAIAISLLIEPLTPGSLVIYAYYCSYKCKKEGIDKVDFDKVVNWFGWGGFSNEDLQSFWDSQKCPVGLTSNMVDLKEPCLSLYRSKS